MNSTIEQNTTVDLIGQLIKITPEFRGKWRLVRFWMNSQKSNHQRKRILPGGAKINCDILIPYEAMVWLEREEQEDLEVVRRLIKPGQTFVDCGANIGIWSFVAASSVGINGKVYSFEANPYTFKKLSLNQELNNSHENIFLCSQAVGSENKPINFLCQDSHNISQVVTHETQNSVLVNAVTLDSVLNIDELHGIKIDVEGFEIHVIKGAGKLLKKHFPWLCVEFNTILVKNNRLGDWDVHQYLSNLGYVCRQFKDALDTSTKNILTDDWQTTGYCNLYYSKTK